MMASMNIAVISFSADAPSTTTVYSSPPPTNNPNSTIAPPSGKAMSRRRSGNMSPASRRRSRLHPDPVEA